MLCESADGQRCSLAVWGDETVVGNLHRPDPNNKYLVIYFTILELPEWWRHSRPKWVMSVTGLIKALFVGALPKKHAMHLYTLMFLAT